MATFKFSSIKLLTITAVITFLFCLAIGFDVTPFLRGPAPYPPEWRWTYQFTNTLGRLWAPVLGISLGLLGFFFFDKEKNQSIRFFTLKFLLFITISTLFLQLNMLFFSRAGIGVLLERIINPGITGYFTTALSTKNIGSFITTYKNNVAYFPMRAADHPPFAVLFFSLLLFTSQHLQLFFSYVAKLSIHHSDIEILWNNLQAYQKLAALLSTVFIPLLSVLVLVPLYFFTNRYYDKKIAVRTCFLYTAFPSLYLFLPLNDVFLGIFTMLGFLFFVLGVQKKNIFYYIFSGLSVAIGIFFSASLLVSLSMLIFMLLLTTKNKKQKILGILFLLSGVGIIPILFFLFFHFNSIEVFTEITKLQAKRSYFPWVFYDLYDFFIFSGIPVLICSILIIKKMLTKQFFKHVLPISFFATFFLLDISGFSRAESGRIWMPYMPILAVIVTSFFTKEKRFNSYEFAVILGLQLLQVLVMQEFWVTLW